MPRGNKQRSRRYWILAALTLALCLCGFWGHTGYLRQHFQQLDDYLFVTARHIALFAAQTDALNPKADQFQTLCSNLDALAAIHFPAIAIAVYSAQGDLVCRTTPSVQENPPLFTTTLSIPDTPELRQSDHSNHHLRSLIFPLTKVAQGGVLELHAGLKSIDRGLIRFDTILLLAGMGILATSVYLLRQHQSRNLTVIRRLTRTMERSIGDTQPPLFRVADHAGREARELARGYNAMMERLANRLRRSQQFAANVTHELRTPLTILRGETELALRNDRDQEQLRLVLESNLEEIQRMSYLIEDLLLLSKSDLGEIPLKMENLNLTEQVTELYHQAQLLAAEKNIAVQLHIPDELIRVHADGFRIRQVLLNLLTNAIKYTPEGGNITISLRKGADQIELGIKDSGIGISAEHLEKIFDRFYRVDKTRNRNDGGSGLGLAIAKWIVNAHGGQIKVSSLPQHGSHFLFTLPLRDESRPQDSSM